MANARRRSHGFSPSRRTVSVSTLLAAAGCSACSDSESRQARQRALDPERPAAESPAADSTAPPTGGPQSDPGAGCPAPALPPFAELPSSPELPDPLVAAGGNRITRRDQRACRRDEITPDRGRWIPWPTPILR